MSRFFLAALLCLALGASFIGASASSASAASTGYRWTSDDKWSFIDHWNDWAIGRGFRYPTLYASCLQKATAAMYPSYTAFLMHGNINRWVNQTAYCMTDYGQHWWDS